MKKSYRWARIAALVLLVAGATFLALAIFTDGHEETYLPVALCGIVAANALMLAVNIRRTREARAGRDR